MIFLKNAIFPKDGHLKGQTFPEIEFYKAIFLDWNHQMWAQDTCDTPLFLSVYQVFASVALWDINKNVKL